MADWLADWIAKPAVLGSILSPVATEIATSCSALGDHSTERCCQQCWLKLNTREVIAPAWLSSRNFSQEGKICCCVDFSIVFGPVFFWRGGQTFFLLFFFILNLKLYINLL